MGYLLLLCRERERERLKVLYFHHSRHLVRMFLIKQALHEWVTVISAEEDTWWGWSVVLAFVTWCMCARVFASEAECTKSSCVLSPSQWRQQSGKSADYEEHDRGRHAHIHTVTNTLRHKNTLMHVHAYYTIYVQISGCTCAVRATYGHVYCRYCGVTIIGKCLCPWAPLLPPALLSFSHISLP